MKLNFTLLLTILLFSLTSQSQIRYLKANLQGSQQVPANGSTATGVVIVKYNTTTKYLEVWGDYQNLTTDASAAHIHSPAPAGSSAPVLIPLVITNGTTGSITGNGTLTAAQELDLFAGNMYVNVHNATYPGGEIRGQLSTTTDGQTEFFNARLQGAQQVPPNGSVATGYVNCLLDKATDSVFVTGSFSGLANTASASHIHTGAPGTNGPVKINLTTSPATAGTIHIAAPILAADKTEMLAGNTYVNVHNASFPGGEIRGQLTQLATLEYFVATLDGTQQVPPNDSKGKGTVIIKFNTITKLMELVGDFQKVSSTVTAAHIHASAGVGQTAGVQVPLTTTGDTSGTITGTATLSGSLEDDLVNGLAYVNVHNANYPGGEIRGQITMLTPNQTQYFKGSLQGTQQVPTNASTGSGSVTAVLDKATNHVYVTANFRGLTTKASAAHIHMGAAGTSGSVVVPLSATADTTGTITGNMIVTPEFSNLMITGNSYVNIHNATYPGGELRAQLGDLVLPVKLLYFNGYKDGDKVSLVWESAQENDLKYYEVEQQKPGTNEWLKKSSVNVLSSTTKNVYRTTDIPVTGSSDFVVYRLKAVDKDGKFSYSQAIRINYRQTNATLGIFPNPVLNNELHYTVTGIKGDKKAFVTIVDVSGKTLLQTTSSTLSNRTVNVSALPTGLYTLIIRLDDGVLQQRFSK